MNYYTAEQIQALPEQTFAFIAVEERGHTLYLTLDRPAKKNAIHPHTVHELAFALQYAHSQPQIWSVVLQARGDVFCSGADLKAFMGMVGEYDSTIPAPAQPVLIGELLPALPKPVIAKVEGDVFAGGFFFLAGSTYVVAREGVRLGLPEVKRGLFPFQVMAALMRVMPERKVIDWCIRGYDLPVAEAHALGLVTHVATAETIDAQVQHLLDELHQNSPSAIRLGLAAWRKITERPGEQEYLMGMLQQVLATQDGQEGLAAFREKRPPVWKGL